MSPDRHAGMTRLATSREKHYARGTEIRNERQITIVSRDELAEVARRMDLPELRPAWIGANLLLDGIPSLTALPPNTRLFFPQSTVLVVQGENLPCRFAGEAIARQADKPGATTLFPKAALHMRGLIACVERPGFITRGDTVRVQVPHQKGYAPHPGPSEQS